MVLNRDVRERTPRNLRCHVSMVNVQINQFQPCFPTKRQRATPLKCAARCLEQIPLFTPCEKTARRSITAVTRCLVSDVPRRRLTTRDNLIHKTTILILDDHFCICAGTGNIAQCEGTTGGNNRRLKLIPSPVVLVCRRQIDVMKFATRVVGNSHTCSHPSRLRQQRSCDDGSQN